MSSEIKFGRHLQLTRRQRRRKAQRVGGGGGAAAGYVERVSQLTERSIADVGVDAGIIGSVKKVEPLEDQVQAPGAVLAEFQPLGDAQVPAGKARAAAGIARGGQRLAVDEYRAQAVIQRHGAVRVEVGVPVEIVAKKEIKRV